MVQCEHKSLAGYWAGFYRLTNLDEGEGVSNIATHTVTDSCEDLSPVAVHKAWAARGYTSIDTR